jgi:hypothetical protein
VLLLIRRYLHAGMMEGGLMSPRTEGTPQGGPLSPLLSNILLDDLDRELERRGHHFVRYADDCNVYVQSRAAGERVLTSLEGYFRMADVRNSFDQLDTWLHRRLRCILWRQWRRPRTRAKELMRLGLDETRAYTSAFNGHGPWWNAGASHMHAAVPTAALRDWGLFSLLDEHRRLRSAL